MKIPCNNCLKLALCRHKSFTTLLQDCDEIRLMLYENPHIFGYRYRMDEFNEITFSLLELMKPTKWDAHFNTYDEQNPDQLTIFRIRNREEKKKWNDLKKLL